MYYPFVKDERVDEELNFALSAFIFAVSRRFVSLNEWSQVTKYKYEGYISLAAEFSR